MRIEISFKAESIPLYYRMGMLSIVKQSLSNSDVSYFNHLFVNASQNMKPFVYSVYLQDFSFHEDRIALKGFRIIISSSNHEFMFHLYNGIQKIKEYIYKEHVWIRGNVRLLNEYSISSEKVLFKTLSPILIESKNGYPIHPTDDNYEKEFNYYANLVVKNILGRPLKRTIKVNPLHMKKVVIKESNRTFNLSKQKGANLYFTAFKGHLLLDGDSDDLTCIYQNGISRRRSMGFGLLEVEMEGGS